jgi:hypothetical protein
MTRSTLIFFFASCRTREVPRAATVDMWLVPDVDYCRDHECRVHDPAYRDGVRDEVDADAEGIAEQCGFCRSVRESSSSRFID